MGTVIIRLKARDRDIGENARIIYEFSQHTAEQYGHLFGMKAESGKIYIKNNLDFEVRIQGHNTVKQVVECDETHESVLLTIKQAASVDFSYAFQTIVIKNKQPMGAG